MQLKELIKELQKLEKEYGDLPVVARNSSLDLTMKYINAYEDDNDELVKQIILSVEYN